MNKEFIPYDEALELKQLGFDEPCIAWYNKIGTLLSDVTIGYESTDFLYSQEDMDSSIDCIALLYQQAFRWFREKHNILAVVYANASGYLYEWEDAKGGTHRGWSDYEGPNESGVWDTYEEAELACLQKLIETVKQKQ